MIFWRFQVVDTNASRSQQEIKIQNKTKYQRKVQSIYMQDVGAENIELLEKDTIEDWCWDFLSLKTIIDGGLEDHRLSPL